MTVATVADHVDHNVLLELLPEVERQLGHSNAGLGVIAVHMKNRGVDDPSHVRTVERTPVGFRLRGKADLVIDHQMQRAAGFVAFELGHVQRFRHDALADKGRVTVDEQRNHPLPLRVAQTILFRPHHTFDDGVYCFQVRRVRRHADDDLTTGRRPANAARAQVILHVPGALHRTFVRIPIKLAEDHLRLLANDVSQNVQTPAVRHADHDLVNAMVGRPGHELIQNRYCRLPAFKREALVANEPVAEKLFKTFRFQHTFQRPYPLAFAQRPIVRLWFHPLLQPGLLLRRLDVHVLATDLAAVGLPHLFEQFAQRRHDMRCPFAHGRPERSRYELPVQVPNRQAVVGRIQFRVVVDLRAERIQIGNQMATHPIRVDQLQNRAFLADFHLAEAAGWTRHGGPIRFPLYGLVRHAEILEDLVVEVVVALQ